MAVSTRLTMAGEQIALLLWRRLDAPGHDCCRLLRQPDGWQISGTAVFAEEGVPSRLDYMITCDAAWQTRSAEVRGVIGTQDTQLIVSVDDEQRWYLNRAECPEVRGCLDLDLGFTPATNVLPIRRLTLDLGAWAAVDAAWLPFPSLTFEVLPQTYRRAGERTYRYESHGGSFTRELQVNDEGLVTSYPGLWEIEVSMSAEQLRLERR